MRTTCREFPLIYSAQIDGRAGDVEQAALQNHMHECSKCRRLATELRNLISDVRSLSDVRHAKIESAPEIQAALRVEAQRLVKRERRRADLIDLWRTRLFSQSIGAIISLSLFLILGLGVFKSAYKAFLSFPPDNNVRIWEWGDVYYYNYDAPKDGGADYQARLKATLLQPPPPPALTPSTELLDFSAKLPEDDVVFAAVKIDKKGHVKVQNATTAQDSSVISKFSNAINKGASFVPNRRKSKTSGEAVVIFSKVNISG